MGDTAPPQLTHFPTINDFLRAVPRYQGGEIDRHELADAFKTAHRYLRHTQALFEQQLRFRERTRLLLSETPRIRAAFQQALAAVEPLAHLLGAEREAPGPELEGALVGLLTHCGTLAASLEALRAEEAGMPVYSRSPHMHTLMRLAVGVKARTLEAEVLRNALREMVVHVQGYAANLDRLVRPGREATLYAERRGSIVEAVGRLERRLLTATDLLATGQLDALITSLQEGCEQAEFLLGVAEELSGQAQARRTRPCMRCGAANERHARHCSACSAQLPAIMEDPDMEAVLDVEVSDTVRQSGHVETEWTQRLNHVVAERLEGQLSDEAFAAALDACTAPIEKGRLELERLPVPQGLEGEELDVLQGTQQQLHQGTEWILEGLEIMRRHLHDANTSHLENGLERALVGADHVYAVKMAADALKAQAHA